MSAVSTAKKHLSKDEILMRKIPQNPKYVNVKSVIDTGATSKKCSQHKSKDVLKMHDEVFKRIKLSTFMSLVVEVSREEINYNRLRQNRLSHTPSPVLAQQDKLSPFQSVINGIGEYDQKGGLYTRQPNIVLAETFRVPYLLLDVRDPDLFQQCHIITAKNYPSSMLCRSCNYETRDLLIYKNVPLHIIVLYDEDETVVPRVAATLTQRGYDNIFLLSGGLKLAAAKFPDGLIIGTLPESCQAKDPIKSKTISRKSPLLTDATTNLNLVKKMAENKFTEEDILFSKRLFYVDRNYKQTNAFLPLLRKAQASDLRRW